MTEISKKVMSQADITHEDAVIKQTKKLLWDRGALYNSYDFFDEGFNEKKPIYMAREFRGGIKDILIVAGMSIPAFVLLCGGLGTTIFTYRAHHNRQMPVLPQKVTDQKNTPQQSGIIRVYE